MRHSIPIALLTSAILFGPLPVLADAAPPENPPGSSILPPGETMVQMVAETVTITVPPSAEVDSPAHVAALFAMRNQGEAQETMQVRFPLENPSGMGDGWGGRPTISRFSAKAAGLTLPITVTEESLAGGPSVMWATFPVTFPPAEDILLSVTYDIQLSKSDDGLDQAQVGYILETGAGWYGPIDTAVLAIRLPYASSPSNVYLSDPWEPQKVPPPVFVGKEVRWEWPAFEPTSSDNLNIVFIWPALWTDILALETQTGQDPSNVALAIRLAEAYRQVASERHGFAVSDPLARLALQAVDFALPFAPTSPDLLWERFIIQTWKCTSFPSCDPDAFQQLLAEYAHLPPFPAGPLPEDLQWRITLMQEAAAKDPATSPQPSSIPSTIQPTRTPTYLELLPPLADADSAAPTASAASTSSPLLPVTPPGTGILIALSFATGSALTALAFGLARRRPPT